MFRYVRLKHAHLLNLALVCFLLISSTTVSADRTDAYRNNKNAVENNSDWMMYLPDDRLLSQLSLLGTHDTGSYNFGGETTETQGMNAAEQLKAGIRAWDMRLGNKHLNLDLQCKAPDLWTFHGIMCQFEKFSDILATAATFLDVHPSETLVMRVRQENGENSDFSTIVEAKMDAFPELFYDGDNVNPTLGEIRGKIVLFRDYSGSARGIPWQSLNIQDQFHVNSNWALAEKWNFVRNQFIDADNTSTSQIYVNFLSAAGGSFPYFVASGKSSWETSAPALLTGWTDGFWPFNSCDRDMNCIDEFYRTNCAFGYALWHSRASI